jgi:hypothetical protein
MLFWDKEGNLSPNVCFNGFINFNCYHCVLIGRSREIYAIDDDRLLKLFLNFWTIIINYTLLCHPFIIWFQIISHESRKAYSQIKPCHINLLHRTDSKEKNYSSFNDEKTTQTMIFYLIRSSQSRYLKNRCSSW